jgi:site-specific DNA-methyltransferase (adenine-specific)
MTEDNITTNVQLENGNPAFAKPVLCAGAVSKDGISLIHGDSLQALKSYDDNHFDIAIVDPPYGIGDKFKGGKTGKMNFNEVVEKDWDKVPPMEYWNELFRVSKNQIIWGGNYFLDFLKATKCFLIYDKKRPQGVSFASCEFAWTSFDGVAKSFYFSPMSMKDRIHPTQKPIPLYEWIFKNYANKTDKVLDTHLGSGSSAIAAYNYGVDFTGIEIDEEFYTAAKKRLIQRQNELDLSF